VSTFVLFYTIKISVRKYILHVMGVWVRREGGLNVNVAMICLFFR